MFGAKPKPQPNCVLDVLALEFELLIDAKKMIDAEVAKRSAAELEGVKFRLSTMAASLGVSIGSLFGITPDKKARKKRKETELRIYINPDNPEQIYKGKGKRPGCYRTSSTPATTSRSSTWTRSGGLTSRPSGPRHTVSEQGRKLRDLLTGLHRSERNSSFSG